MGGWAPLGYEVKDRKLIINEAEAAKVRWIFEQFTKCRSATLIAVYRYYVSQTILKAGAGACPIGRVPAAEIEGAVVDQLRILLRSPEIVAATWRAARQQSEAVTEEEVREALHQFDPLWYELFPAEQARIVQLVVERVDVGLEGLAIRLHSHGLGSLYQELTGSADLRSAA